MGLARKRPVGLNGWVFVYQLSGCGFEIPLLSLKPLVSICFNYLQSIVCIKSSISKVLKLLKLNPVPGQSAKSFDGLTHVSKRYWQSWFSKHNLVYYEFRNIGISVKLKQNLFSGTFKTIIEVLFYYIKTILASLMSEFGSKKNNGMYLFDCGLKKQPSN